MRGVSGGRSRTSEVLLGRADELEFLAAVAGRVTSAGHHAVLIEGEAGIGKSALCRAFLADLHEAGWLTLEGRCLQFAGTPVPLAALVAPARDALAALAPSERAGVPLAGLARLLPELGTNGADSSSTDVASAQLFDGVRALLSRAAVVQPVVVLVEDLHWADPATLDQVSWLVNSLRDEPVLIVCTVRTAYEAAEEFVVWSVEHRRIDWFDSLALGGLDLDAVTDLVARTGSAADRGLTLESLVDRTGGNPYFVKEFLASNNTETILPTTLAASLTTRLDGLSEAELDLVGSLAVLGGEADQIVLHTMQPEGFESTARSLRAAGLIELEGGAIRFRHALVGEVVNDRLLATERADAHRRAAVALEARSPTTGSLRTLVELAGHWSLAGEPQRSLTTAIEAGRAAAAVGAAVTAAELGAQAVQAAGGLVGDDRLDPSARANVLIEAVDWMFAASNVSGAIEAIRAALAEGWALTLAAPRRGRLLASMAAGEWLDGDPARAVELFEQATELVSGDRSEDAAAVLYQFARNRLRQGDATGAAGPAREALSIAEDAANGALIVDATTVLALCAGVNDSIEAGIALTRRARSTAISLGLAGRASHTYVTEGHFQLHRTGRSPAWRDANEKALAYAIENCGPLQQAAVRVQLALGLTESGLFLDARPHIDELLGLPLSRLDLLVTLQAVALLNTRTGDPDAATAALDEADQLAAHYRTAGESGFQLRLRGELARRSGDFDRARTLLDQAIELQTDSENTAFLRESLFERIQVEREANSPTNQRHGLITELRALVDLLPTGAPPDAVWRRVMDAEINQLAEPGIGDVDDLAADLDRCGYYFDAAELRLRHLAHDSRSEREDIEAQLRALRSVSEKLGAVPLDEQIRFQATALRVELDMPERAVKRAPGRPFDLTARELEVLDAVARGLTNKDIGAELHISVRTASTHVSRILAKLGAKRRGEAAAIYRDLR